jgi:hypothetical protein
MFPFCKRTNNVSLTVTLSLVLGIVACTDSKHEDRMLRAFYPDPMTPAWLVQSTRDSTLPSRQTPGLVFKYGFGCDNILNTFTGTFSIRTDSLPYPSVRLDLTRKELDSVQQKMRDINFFQYPDTFATTVQSGVSVISPHSSYYFGVVYQELGRLKTKELWWEDGELTSDYLDERAIKLRELIQLIRTIVESKQEYVRMEKPQRIYI